MNCTACNSPVYKGQLDGSIICYNEKCVQRFFISPDEEFKYAKKYKLPLYDGDIKIEVSGGYKYASISFGTNSIDGKTHIKWYPCTASWNHNSTLIPFVKIPLNDDEFETEIGKLRIMIEKIIMLQ